jgi:aspartate/methionine/tyrosine aminotransferase
MSKDHKKSKKVKEETKHILPDNPTGSSMGNDDLKDWIKVFSLF